MCFGVRGSRVAGFRVIEGCIGLRVSGRGLGFRISDLRFNPSPLGCAGAREQEILGRAAGTVGVLWRRNGSGARVASPCGCLGHDVFLNEQGVGDVWTLP